jgi:hypothetical protein
MLNTKHVNECFVRPKRALISEFEICISVVDFRTTTVLSL